MPVSTGDYSFVMFAAALATLATFLFVPFSRSQLSCHDCLQIIDHKPTRKSATIRCLSCMCVGFRAEPPARKWLINVFLDSTLAQVKTSFKSQQIKQQLHNHPKFSSSGPGEASGNN